MTSININKITTLENLRDQYILHREGDHCFVTTKNNKMMNPALQSTGYRQYHFLDNEGKTVTVLQHRLFALAFIENPDQVRCIDHLNNVRDDNRLSNLQWVTHGQNSLKMTQEGRAPKGERGKVTMADLINIFVLSKKGLSQFEIARRHQIDYTYAGKILRETVRKSDIAWLREQGHI